VEGRARARPRQRAGLLLLLLEQVGRAGLEPDGREDAAGAEEALGLGYDLEFWMAVGVRSAGYKLGGTCD
jgi:hypothetical protein